MSRSNTYGRISATYQSIEDTSKFEHQQWPKRPTMAKKTNNGQKKKGQKDKKWSTKYYTEN